MSATRARAFTLARLHQARDALRARRARAIAELENLADESRRATLARCRRRSALASLVDAILDRRG
jgi:hypothetical protein